jgi:hypothetical protein
VRKQIFSATLSPQNTNPEDFICHKILILSPNLHPDPTPLHTDPIPDVCIQSQISISAPRCLDLVPDVLIRVPKKPLCSRSETLIQMQNPNP